MKYHVDECELNVLMFNRIHFIRVQLQRGRNDTCRRNSFTEDVLVADYQSHKECRRTFNFWCKGEADHFSGLNLKHRPRV